jgi:hypothetical protein
LPNAAEPQSSIIVSAPAFRIGRFVLAPRAHAFDSRPRTHSALAVSITLAKINTPISPVLINPFTPANNATQLRRAKPYLNHMPDNVA